MTKFLVSRIKTGVQRRARRKRRITRHNNKQGELCQNTLLLCHGRQHPWNEDKWVQKYGIPNDSKLVTMLDNNIYCNPDYCLDLKDKNTADHLPANYFSIIFEVNSYFGVWVCDDYGYTKPASDSSAAKLQLQSWKNVARWLDPNGGVFIIEALTDWDSQHRKNIAIFLEQNKILKLDRDQHGTMFFKKC
jgi:hypothetical protein